MANFATSNDVEKRGNDRNFELKIGHVQDVGGGRYEVEAELVDDEVGFYRGSVVLRVDTNRGEFSTY